VFLTVVPFSANMISNFFVLSPRGDTILAKQYRTNEYHHAAGGPVEDGMREMNAHERSHTEALFRRIKFWDDYTNAPSSAMYEDNTTEGAWENDDAAAENGASEAASTMKRLKGDAPPVLLMPDGFTYFHVKRNGLLFCASSARNVSPNTVIEVSGSLACMLSA
jgi:AP-4 complex subunit mu-1